MSETHEHESGHGHDDEHGAGGHGHDTAHGEHAAHGHDDHGHGGHHGPPELPPLADEKQPTREQFAALNELVQSASARLEGRNRAVVLRAIGEILKDKSVKESLGMLISKVQQRILTELERRETRKTRQAQDHGRSGGGHGHGTGGSHGRGSGH